MFLGPIGGGVAATVSESYPHFHASAVTCAFYTVTLTPLPEGQVRQWRRGYKPGIAFQERFAQSRVGEIGR